MGNTLIARRLYVVLLLGLALTAALLLFTADVAWAHPCDDNYTDPYDSANCWWRYWNGQSTPEDLTLSADPDGMLCNTLNAIQKNRENCWWNYQNGLPLITEQPVPPAGMLEPYDMMKSDSMMGDMAMAADMMKSDSMMGDMMKSDDMMGDMEMAADMMKSDSMMGDMMKSDDMMGDMEMAADPGGMLCNTLNAIQKNRENCWWNYQNGLPLITEQPLPPVATMKPNGMLCNTLNTMQKNRENCWWNYQNDLPLITEQPMMSEGMMGDMMKSDDM